MRGTRVETRPRGSLGEPLADQLPEGESWRVEVPAVIDWISVGDRSAEIDTAARDWSRAMREYFARRRASRRGTSLRVRSAADRGVLILAAGGRDGCAWGEGDLKQNRARARVD